MADARPELRRGRIIWVVLADTRGHIKRRPAIVLTPIAEITEDQDISVMAISTAYPEPPPTGYVELPWHNDWRRTTTRLTKRSAAVVNWLRFIREDEIEEFAGDVPPRIMLDILKRLEEMG